MYGCDPRARLRADPRGFLGGRGCNLRHGDRHRHHRSGAGNARAGLARACAEAWRQERCLCRCRVDDLFSRRLSPSPSFRCDPVRRLAGTGTAVLRQSLLKWQSWSGEKRLPFCPRPRRDIPHNRLGIVVQGDMLNRHPLLSVGPESFERLHLREEGPGELVRALAQLHLSSLCRAGSALRSRLALYLISGLFERVSSACLARFALQLVPSQHRDDDIGRAQH